MEHNKKPTIMELLRKLRKERGVTQEVAAVGMGINSATLRKLETFVSMPGVPLLEKVAAYYDMTTSQLLDAIDTDASFREAGEVRERLPPQERYQGPVK